MQPQKKLLFIFALALFSRRSLGCKGGVQIKPPTGLGGGGGGSGNQVRKKHNALDGKYAFLITKRELLRAEEEPP